MIITRTPLRISFVGGGSDLPEFFKREPGFVVSATINKYIYISVQKHYEDTVRVSYSKTEEVNHARDLEHPLIRNALRGLMVNINKGIEIVSMAEVPSGTGLGSSSAFAVGLMNALYAYRGHFATKEQLAHDACRLEITMAESPIGMQDQYAAAYGGLRGYTFHPPGDNYSWPYVSTEKLPIHSDILSMFQSRLLLFDTGIRRDANAILREQSQNMHDSRKRADVRAMVNMAISFRDNLVAGNLDTCGDILDGAWRLKRNLASGVASDVFDEAYRKAKLAGARGGKICGAGGGGFLLIYADPDDHGEIKHTVGLRHVPIQLEPMGSIVIHS